MASRRPLITSALSHPPRSFQLYPYRAAILRNNANRGHSILAADYAVPSFLIRSGVAPDIFQSHRLRIEDQVELYTKRLSPQTREIRLLFILPAKDTKSGIELLMVHCLLDDAPPYLALSYTGGYPFATSKRHEHRKNCDEELYQAEQSVLVNGIELHVKLNLYQSLLKFRKSHASIPIWIDSICMNEGDPIERPEQIRMMGDIYGKAKEVLIWLGEIETMVETKIAMDMITGIVDNFKIWYDEECVSVEISEATIPVLEF